ncbi:regulator of volume decrease after cellular swelling-domain-containing protein [Roridomyces roridus]|uniref:Regulator of volume decrease after cellular swelling-domain-containing protein n=1 Tax=Roridomyces roridus TaxID=1738132 RepID=A0AAD7FWA6_9AGAR|nr:regulator of volume decrease after cellular swelling-domain-containing protein [Roridomyces roridus]
MPSAAILISSIPSFVSREEHTTLASQTPASFADIPPVLRLKQEGVTVRFEPPLDGFSEQDSAEGTLFVIESVLVFMSTTGRGWQIEYPSITLHAMSRGEAGPSIYCQLDESVGSSNDDGDAEMRELSIIPMDATSLEPIFDALSHCATLHPDKADEDAMADDDDDADEAFVDMDDAFEPFTGEDGQELSQAGRVRSDFVNDNRYAPY